MIDAAKLKLLAWVSGAVMAALLAAVVVQTVRLADERRDHAKTVADHATKIAAMETGARLAIQAARDEEHRRAVEAQKAADEARKELETARADAAAAAVVGERLRDKLAAIAARSCGASQGAAAVSGGQAAPAAGNLLADVFGRLEAAQNTIAEYADRARTAGRTCEKRYDAVAD